MPGGSALRSFNPLEGRGLRLKFLQDFLNFATAMQRADAHAQKVAQIMRARQRDKRGGADSVWVTLSQADGLPSAADQPLDLVAVGEALEQLRRLDPSLAELLDQVGFAGLEPAEVAELRGVSLRTVQRELAKARALLAEML